MSRRITLRGKTVELSDADHDQLAHFGAEVGLGMFGTLQNSEAMQRPFAGPTPPRLRPDIDLAHNRATAAERAHNVVAGMRRSRGQLT